MTKKYFKKFGWKHARVQENPARGFTLIEIMVSICIFSIVMAMGMGAILTLVNVNRQAQAMRVAMDNINFALDSMSRDIRVGTKYSLNCANNSSPCQDFSFTDKYGRQVEYSLVNSAIEKTITVDGKPNTSPMTAPELTINNLEFYYTNAANNLNPHLSSISSSRERRNWAYIPPIFFLSILRPPFRKGSFSLIIQPRKKS